MDFNLEFGDSYRWFPPSEVLRSRIPKEVEDIMLTKPQKVIVIQWRWRGKTEEFKRFYVTNECKSLYISKHDLKYLEVFSQKGGKLSLFSSIRLEQSIVSVSESVYDQIKAVTVQNLDTQVLIPSLPHGDISSNHFGHFFAEEIPHLIAADMIGLPLLCNRRLLTAHSQLIDLLNLNRISSNIRTIADYETNSILHLPDADVSIVGVVASFVKYDTQFIDRIFNRYCKPYQNLLSRTHSPSERIAVISRRYLADKPQRWQDVGQLNNYSSFSGFTYHMVYPEKLGPLATSELLRLKNIRLVVSAPSSALYQFFADIIRQYEILIVLGAMNPKSPHQYFSTFYPFRNFCWLLYTQSDSTQEWDNDYSCPPEIIESAANYILRGNKTAETTIIAKGYTLEAPGFGTGKNLKYGLHV